MFALRRRPEAWVLIRIGDAWDAHSDVENSAEVLADKYELMAIFHITMRVDGNRLFTQATGHPEFELIAEGAYPVSRPLYFYAKAAHIGVIAGLEEFMLAFTDEQAFGEEGYLTDKGLIPMPDEERSLFRGNVENRTPLSM